MQLTETVALVGSGDARLTSKYDCNIYAIDAPDGTILVDTGAGETVPSLLERANRTFGPVTHAVLTHAHADHSQGGPTCQERGVEVIAGDATATLLRSGSDEELGLDAARREGVYPTDYSFDHFAPDRTVAVPTSMTVAGRRFEVVPLRGHATDHVVYLTTDAERTYCFVGDAVYPDGSISLLNVPGSSLADYRTDIGVLADRDIDVLLPGHGMARLADGQAAVERAAEALEGMSTPPTKT